MSKEQKSLAGRTIGVPESRQLDLFANMLEQRGATTLRCPLVAIRDTADTTSVARWFASLDDDGVDRMIWLTGEGVRRLAAFADRHGYQRVFDRLTMDTCAITRGPKPVRELKKHGASRTIAAGTPTTDGVIETLRSLDLDGQRVGVQLYGDEPNRPLIDALTDQGATALSVAPYTYADGADTEATLVFIDHITNDKLDAVAFTSASQIDRLIKLARRHRQADELIAALNRICVAAVGPLVADRLRRESIEVTLMPSDNYFMKPLVRSLTRYFETGS